jgi:hypothetical protein
MFRLPCPAPNRHSARAAALASLSTRVSTPNASRISSPIGTFDQPARLGWLIRIPRSGSTGPGTETPIRWSGPLPAAVASWTRRRASSIK